MMRQLLAWMMSHKSSDQESSDQDAEVHDLRRKMRREATAFSLANKIALRSALLNEMIGIRDQNNDHH